MDGRISAGDWSLLLIPLGTPLYALLCAQMGQRIAYRRGYLKRGYVLGLLGGPLGLLACLALPPFPQPLLEIEAVLHYGTDDPQSRRWRGSLKWTFILMLYLGLLWLSLPGWVPARVDWFTPPLDLATRWWLHLPVLLGGAAFCWYSFSRRAQPPLHFLYPLPGAAGPGMGELLHWTSLRYSIARAMHQADLLERFGGCALLSALTVLLVFGLSFVDTALGWNVRTVMLALALALGFGLWLALRQGVRIELALEALRRRARSELGADPLRHSAPVLHALAPGRRAPDEVLQRLDRKTREVMADSRGMLGRDSARRLAAATLDADGSARRLLFLKPALALGGGYLLLKLLFFALKGGRFTEIGRDAWLELQQTGALGQPHFWVLAVLFLVALAALLVLLTQAQRYLLRRRREQDPD